MNIEKTAQNDSQMRTHFTKHSTYKSLYKETKNNKNKIYNKDLVVSKLNIFNRLYNLGMLLKSKRERAFSAGIICKEKAELANLSFSPKILQIPSKSKESFEKRLKKFQKLNDKNLMNNLSKKSLQDKEENRFVPVINEISSAIIRAKSTYRLSSSAYDRLYLEGKEKKGIKNKINDHINEEIFTFRPQICKFVNFSKSTVKNPNKLIMEEYALKKCPKSPSLNRQEIICSIKTKSPNIRRILPVYMNIKKIKKNSCIHDETKNNLLIQPKFKVSKFNDKILERKFRKLSSRIWILISYYFKEDIIEEELSKFFSTYLSKIIHHTVSLLKEEKIEINKDGFIEYLSNILRDVHLNFILKFEKEIKQLTSEMDHGININFDTLNMSKLKNRSKLKAQARDLYQESMEKKKQCEEKIKRLKEKKEADIIRKCTFKPIINKPQKSLFEMIKN